jgi:hypothetical protein
LLRVLGRHLKAETVAVATATTAASALAHLAFFRHHQKPIHAPAARMAVIKMSVEAKLLSASMGDLSGMLGAERRAERAAGGEGGGDGHDDPEDQGLVLVHVQLTF